MPRARRPIWKKPARTWQAQGIDARWVAADVSQSAEVERVAERGAAAPGRYRHPRQQRRRHLGRAGRGLSAGSLGQGDEPEHPRHLPDEPADGQAQHDPARSGASSTSPSIAGLGGRRATSSSSPTAPARARWSTSPRTLAGEWGEHGITVNALAPGFFPSKMTKGTIERSAPTSLAGPRRCAASATTTT